MKMSLSSARGKAIAAAATLLAAAGLWWCLDATVARGPSGPPLALTLALPTELSGGALFVAQDQRLFADKGITVTAQPFLLGKMALESVLQGRADMAIVADTPFMLSVMRGNRIATVASVFASRKTMAVLARRSSGIATPADIKGKTIGTVVGTNAQYFLHALMVAHGIQRDQVTIVDYAPDALAAALRSGRIDGATMWHPDIGRMQRELGVAVAPVFAEDVFAYRFLLVGTTDYIDANGPAISRLLAGLDAGADFIHARPAQARQIVGKAIGLDPLLLAGAFDPGDYQLALDQSLLLALDDQTRWAVRQGIIAPAAVPNYLDMVRTKPLQAVRPNAIRIIN